LSDKNVARSIPQTACRFGSDYSENSFLAIRIKKVIQQRIRTMMFDFDFFLVSALASAVFVRETLRDPQAGQLPPGN
jgi:hypothetical protein